MKNIVLLLAALMFMQAAAFAVPDSVTTGPYNISFDLGLPLGAYTVAIQNPVVGETLGGDTKRTYRVDVADNKGISHNVKIILEMRESMEVFSGATIAGGLQIAVAKLYEDVEAAQRIIDGKSGAVAKGTRYTNDNKLKVTIKEDEYFINYYPYKDTSAFILSTFPWEEGTLSLLKTIHIEKVNATA
jgi:hypothetical protein